MARKAVGRKKSNLSTTTRSKKENASKTLESKKRKEPETKKRSAKAMKGEGCGAGDRVQKIEDSESPGGPGYRRNQKYSPPAPDCGKRVWTPPKVRARNWVATIQYAKHTKIQVFKYLKKHFCSLKAFAVAQEDVEDGFHIHLGLRPDFGATYSVIRNKLKNLDSGHPILIDATDYAVTGSWKALNDCNPLVMGKICGFGKKGEDPNLWYFPDLSDLLSRDEKNDEKSPGREVTKEKTAAKNKPNQTAPPKRGIKERADRVQDYPQEQKKKQVEDKLKRNPKRKLQSQPQPSSQPPPKRGAVSDKSTDSAAPASPPKSLPEKNKTQLTAQHPSPVFSTPKVHGRMEPSPLAMPTLTPAMGSRSRDWYVALSGVELSKADLFQALRAEYKFLWYLVVSQGSRPGQMFVRLQLGQSVQRENVNQRVGKFQKSNKDQPVIEQTRNASDAEKHLYHDDPKPLVHGRPFALAGMRLGMSVSEDQPSLERKTTKRGRPPSSSKQQS